MSVTLRLSLCCFFLVTAFAAVPGVSGYQRTQDQQEPPVKPVAPQSGKPLGLDPLSNSGRALGEVALDVSRGVQVELGNRSTGRITVTGWDRDLISARALSSRGSEVVIVKRFPDAAARIFLKADYADLESSDPTGVLEGPPSDDEGRALQINLEVSLPRYALIDVIRVIRSNVQVINVDTPITIVGDRSSVILKQIGAVEVHTRSGNVEIESANGLVQVSTASGFIRVTNAKSGLRAVSIAGPIEVRCARGRVDVSNTDAPINFYDVAGDVDAIASNSSVQFQGELQEDGRYHLRSMSGKVEMILPSNIGGFNATLTSYRGVVESDFPLKAVNTRRVADVRPGEDDNNRRLSGQFRNPRAQIWLDSFEGTVRLTSRAPAPSSCK
jgi:hypothetical protein